MKKPLGNMGEEAAVRFLKKKGYKVIERNYRTPLGEIDIIAMDRKTLVFVEVKTRTSNLFGLPVEAVNSRKRQKIEKAALYYMLKNKGQPIARFDVVSVWMMPDRQEIEHLKDAFEVRG